MLFPTANCVLPYVFWTFCSAFLTSNSPGLPSRDRAAPGHSGVVCSWLGAFSYLFSLASTLLLSQLRKYSKIAPNTCPSLPHALLLQHEQACLPFPPKKQRERTAEGGGFSQALKFHSQASAWRLPHCLPVTPSLPSLQTRAAVPHVTFTYKLGRKGQKDSNSQTFCCCSLPLPTYHAWLTHEKTPLSTRDLDSNSEPYISERRT